MFCATSWTGALLWLALAVGGVAAGRSDARLSAADATWAAVPFGSLLRPVWLACLFVLSVFPYLPGHLWCLPGWFGVSRQSIGTCVVEPRAADLMDGWRQGYQAQVAVMGTCGFRLANLWLGSLDSLSAVQLAASCTAYTNSFKSSTKQNAANINLVCVGAFAATVV